MNTLLPLLQGNLPPSFEFIPAIVVGILFGAALEVAGFGNSKYLAGQFYFHDMRVFKVMFTAIITAATGAAVLSSTGLLGMELLYIPDTFLLPHLVGGFVLGLGFMLSAYCPGTSIVGAASGKIDGLVTVLGVIAGSALFGEIYPFMSNFYVSTAKGVLTFPGLLGIPFPVLTAILVAVAILAFFGADKLEGIFARILTMPRGTGMTRGAKRLLGVVFSLTVLAVIFQYTLAPHASATAPREAASVTPLQLAQMLVEEPRSLYLVDLRKGNSLGGTEAIPRSVRFDNIKDNLDTMYRGKTMVLYSQKGDGNLPAEAFRYRGRLVRLAGGYDAWKSEIMGKSDQTPQKAIGGLTDDEKKVAVAIHASFTGAKIKAPAESGSKPAIAIMAPKKRGGGCS
jgi:uncharacterized protein